MSGLSSPEGMPIIELSALSAEMAKAVPDYIFGLPSPRRFQRRSERLKREFPGLVKSEIIGESTEGRKIESLTIGHGEKHSVWIGGITPNEVIGITTADVLSEQLCRNPNMRPLLDEYTFHIVKIADPDGVNLNKGWFRRFFFKKFSLLKYMKECYRAPLSEQAAWTFPITHKDGVRFNHPTAETQALINLLRSIPQFQLSKSFFYLLHNAGFTDGVYFHLSQSIPELHTKLEQIVRKNDMSIYTGPPEEPTNTHFEAGFLGPPSPKRRYEDFMEINNESPEINISTDFSIIGGGGLLDYTQDELGVSPFTLVTEVPYFKPIVKNVSSKERSKSSPTLRKITEKGIEESQKILDSIAKYLEELEDQGKLPDNRLSRSAAWRVKAISDLNIVRNERLNGPRFTDRPATDADIVSLICTPILYNALFLGEVHRLAKQAGDRRLASKIKNELIQIIRSIESRGFSIEPLPLQQLVRIQLLSGLAAMQYAGTQPQE